MHGILEENEIEPDVIGKYHNIRDKNEYEQIKEELKEYLSESDVKPLEEVNSSVNSISEGCSCEPSILVVDDTDFNLLALKVMITEKYQIVPDEA